jgi:acyl carrier protein
MTREEIFEQVKEVIADRLGLDPDEIKMESRLIEDLGADSLDNAELVMNLEEKFGIEIPDEDQAKIQTIEDIVNYIEEKLKNS